MKIIMSEGGPLIGLNRHLSASWRGVGGKGFVGPDFKFITDYDAACDPSFSAKSRPRNVNKICGLNGEALLLTPSLETTFIAIDDKKVYMLQLDYGEESWSFQSLKEDILEEIQTDIHNSIKITLEHGTFIIFDSANEVQFLSDDFLEFDIEGGHYMVSEGMYRPDKLTCVLIYKMEKII